MKEITYAFDLLEVPLLPAFLKLDTADLPERTSGSSECRVYSTQELHVLYNFPGNEATNKYHGRITRSEKLFCCPYEKTFFLVSQVPSFRHTKQTSKNVVGTTFNFAKTSKFLLIIHSEGLISIKK